MKGYGESELNQRVLIEGMCVITAKDPDGVNAVGLKVTGCNRMGGVKCYHMEENTTAHVKAKSIWRFCNSPSLLTEMKHVMLKKSGMHLEEESCFPNRLRMGNTSKRVSTICVFKERHNVCF